MKRYNFPGLYCTNTNMSNNSLIIIELDKEISSLQFEYKDLVNLNDTLISENAFKDDQIQMKRKQIHGLKKTNEANLQQCHFEDNCFVEECQHEILLQSNLLSELRLEISKLENLERDSCQIRNSITQTLDTLQKTSIQHAIKMYDINKSIRDYREELESTLRKELSRIHRVYQKEAFEVIDPYKKEILLQYAMINDEISLQDLGKASLNLRYKKQEKSYIEYQEQIRSLNAFANEISQRLSLLNVARLKLHGMIQNIGTLSDSLGVYKDKLNLELQQSSVIESNAILKLQIYEQEMLSVSFNIWVSLVDQLESINASICNDRIKYDTSKEIVRFFETLSKSLGGQTVDEIVDCFKDNNELQSFVKSILKLRKNDDIIGLLNLQKVSSSHQKFDSSCLWTMNQVSLKCAIGHRSFSDFYIISLLFHR